MISRIVTFAARGSLYGSHDLSTLRRGGGSSLPVTVTSEGLYIYHISLPNYTYILYIVCSGKRLGGHGSWMVVVAAHFSIILCTYMTYICMKCIKLCTCCMIPYCHITKETAQFLRFRYIVLLGLFLEFITLSHVVFHVLYLFFLFWGGSAVDPTRQQSPLGFITFLVSDPYKPWLSTATRSISICSIYTNVYHVYHLNMISCT